jgi:hypothetical protein
MRKVRACLIRHGAEYERRGDDIEGGIRERKRLGRRAHDARVSGSPREQFVCSGEVACCSDLAVEGAGGCE